MCLCTSVYMPLRTERDVWGVPSYKHIAPPEQRPGVTEQTFRAKPHRVIRSNRPA
jgi:hypothetical protein